jgi:hypothetical protein
MITWTVAFDENSFTTGGVNILDSTNFNPTQKGAKLRELLTNAVRSAGEEWGKYLQGSTNIVVQVVNDPDLGTSSTSNYQTSNTVSTSRLNKNYPLPQLRESILAHKIITGNDANGAAPDVVINIGSSYLKNNFWFDPATFPSYAENLPDSQKKGRPLVGLRP